MKHLLKATLATSLLLAASLADAVTVKDRKGEFTLDKTPSRIVALEYSYVDALAQVGVSPVGVADDNDKTRILQQVRDKIQPWESVGTRSQPSLEAISSLKPDLIIADDNRHSAVLEELKKIAPTVVFNSRNESYTENLETAQSIGELVGKGKEMKTRIEQHNQVISDIAKTLPKDLKIVFGISRPTQFRLFTDESYTGGLLKLMGFTVAEAKNEDKASEIIGLEQLAAQRPEWLFIAHYADESIVKKWTDEALWKVIPAVKKNQIHYVEPNLWSRARGMEASEIMAKEIQKDLVK